MKKGMKNIIALFLTITLLFTGTDLRVFAMCDNPVSVQEASWNPSSSAYDVARIGGNLTASALSVVGIIVGGGAMNGGGIRFKANF